MTESVVTKHRDPVCGMDVDESSAAGRSSHQGKEYYFCSTGCKSKFDSNPEHYLGSGPKKSGGCCGG